MELIIIGDSHVWAFKDHYKTLWIDKPTAHNIHKYEDVIYDNLVDGINLFLFGEIDCRIHFWYQHKKTNNYIMDLIFTTIKRYLDFLLKIDKKIGVISISPPGNQLNIFNYPYYASYDQMKYIYNCFNTVLKIECMGYNIPFINYYQDVIDDNLDRKKEFIADDCHLNEKIIPFFKRRLNEKKFC